MNGIEQTQSLTLNSKVLGETRAFTLYLPPDYETREYAPVAYPVMYLLDGDQHGALVATIVNAMSQNGQIPEVIIVALGNSEQRIRDYTPSHGLADWQGKPQSRYETSGGGDVFLRFIAEELIPYVDHHFRTLAHRTLVGHSFGGLLALHSVAQQNAVFQAHMVLDASVWWDKQRQVEDLITRHKQSPLKGNVYVAMAQHEVTGPNEHARMVEGQQRFFQALKKDKENSSPGSPLQFESFPDERHGTVLMPSLYSGLNTIFRGYQLTPDWAADMAEITSHFQHFANHLGVDYSPPEKILEMLAWKAAQLFDEPTALQFRLAQVDLYPHSKKAQAQWRAAHSSLSHN